jgi:hypothetical protein
MGYNILNIPFIKKQIFIPLPCDLQVANT